MADESKAPKQIQGAGYAKYAGMLAELRRKQKEAALAGDYDKVDAIERQIQDLYREMQGGNK